MKQKAFTLMELMIVIVIIGILSAVGMVMFGGQTEKAKIAATKANFRNIQNFLVVEFMPDIDCGSVNLIVWNLEKSDLMGIFLLGFVSPKQ